MMREKRIGILCLQETHLTHEHERQIDNLFSRRLLVLNSSDPDRPGNSAGIAFVVNKELTNTANVKMTVLVPGRAAVLSMKWHNEKNITLLNIYAPNNAHEHPIFWTKVREKWLEAGLNNPDFMLGDFNLTEDPLDRSPARLDNENAIEALRQTRNALNLQDSWRLTFPHRRMFTHSSSNNDSLSRLDRIYVSAALNESTTDWDSYISQVPTDHKMVLTRSAPPGLPHIGKGRWAWPIGILSDESLIEKIVKLGIETQQEIEKMTHRDDTMNPQIAWMNFKSTMNSLAKDTAKVHMAKINQRIRQLTKDLHHTTNSQSLDTSNDLRSHCILLEKEIEHLQKKRYKNAHLRAQAQWAIKGETLCKYWSKVNSPKKPRDIIYGLRKPGSPHLTTKSEDMAEIARDYHDKVQQTDLLPEEIELRQQTIIETLSNIPCKQCLEVPPDTLLEPLHREQILEALCSSKAGSAAGIDGIPYEAWRALHEHHTAANRSNKPSFDVLSTLTYVINDIQINGVLKDSNFTLGWMCPLYKKKDRTAIENYRPITLLNTDYKLLTKALAMQLGRIIHTLVHPDQSGFIPKRSIFNPIRLTQAMATYADVLEEDGVIIALDQEKAYDRIRHDYLLTTLTSFNLPPLFVNTVKSLYESAYTKVAINGFLSSPFQVTRGVRQGDPLSCLLFDLAIEPLACALRNSPKLWGYNVPGLTEKIIINLYADDTTIYLAKEDRYSDLEDILQSWCRASGAKFNLEKTEILPIGSPAHRASVVINRKFNEDDEPWSDHVKIASDGNPIRTLGAWVGNELDHAAPWEPVLTKIEQNLTRWNLGHPTLDGKRLIVQMVVGGMTQFLTKAQGMPKPVETALTKCIRQFMWDGRTTSPISLGRLYQPKSKGGIGLLNIHARNQAIEITWLRSYMDVSPSRPSWAFVTDAIISSLKAAYPSASDDPRSFLTAWAPPAQGPRVSSLSKNISNLLKTAKKHCVSFAPIKMHTNLKLLLPAWDHMGAPPKTYNKKKDACLRTVHRIRTVNDLFSLTTRLRTNGPHQARRNCACNPCKNDLVSGCPNPHKCASAAQNILQKLPSKYDCSYSPQRDNLTLTHRRKEKNARAILNRRGEVTFDPSVTENDLSACMRIFTNGKEPTYPPAYRLRAPPAREPLVDDQTIIYTDGSCLNNGRANAKCGSGIWISPEHPLNRAIKVPGDTQSNQLGELTAILVALQLADPRTPLKIVTDSRYATEGLTSHLSHWEDRGWIGISHGATLRAIAYHLRKRAAPTALLWVKGHADNEGNEQADHLASLGAAKALDDEVDLSIPDNFDLQGAKLRSVTQAIAYSKISGQTHLEYNRKTIELLDVTRHAVHQISTNMETDETIWLSCRKKDIAKKVQIFIFKTLHNAYRIGEFWLNIPQNEHRAMCSVCRNETESMDHILTECTHPTRRTIWMLARDLWPSQHGRWPEPTIGSILGCGALNLPHTTDNTDLEDKARAARKRGASRLLRLLLSESAHLIWTLRCERVIGGTAHPEETIAKRWQNNIDRRLQIDRAIACKNRRNKKSIAQVRNTWADVIETTPPMSNDWVTTHEVLVGIRLPRPPQNGGTG